MSLGEEAYMSVLSDVKAFCGISWDNYDFDVELRSFINAALSTLTELGVDVKTYVTNQEIDWPQVFAGAFPEEVKPFVYLKVRQLFDPPQNAFLVSAIDKQLQELAWRINIHVERHQGGVDKWRETP